MLREQNSPVPRSSRSPQATPGPAARPPGLTRFPTVSSPGGGAAPGARRQECWGLDRARVRLSRVLSGRGVGGGRGWGCGGCELSLDFGSKCVKGGGSGVGGGWSSCFGSLAAPAVRVWPPHTPAMPPARPGPSRAPGKHPLSKVTARASRGGSRS